MRLTLLRHGTAAESHPSGEDAQRELVGQGQREARDAGWSCRRQGWVPSVVLASPYRRTWETARLFCEEGGFDPPVEQAFLASGMSVEEAIDGLRGYLDLERVVIVGHQPDLGELICFLTGLPRVEVSVGKGSLRELELDSLEEGGARQIYALTAREIQEARSRG